MSEDKPFACVNEGQSDEEWGTAYAEGWAACRDEARILLNDAEIALCAHGSPTVPTDVVFDWLQRLKAEIAPLGGTTDRCDAMVYADPRRAGRYAHRQCLNAATVGEYCRVHAPSEAARAAAPSELAE